MYERYTMIVFYHKKDGVTRVNSDKLEKGQIPQEFIATLNFDETVTHLQNI